jgi:putative ABC transport system ATP-binding protein
MIKLHDVRRLYRMGDEMINALAGINLEINQGEFLSVVGPSGSGKSTLLNIIGGLDSPTSGRIVVEGRDLSKASDAELSSYRNNKVGFIFQTFNLHPRYTATENVALPLVFARVPLKNRRDIAQKVLEVVDLPGRLKHRPNQLSGGERQRVAIARALVNDPKILLADEPTGNIDSKTSEHIIEIMGRLSRERGITLVMVTHDMRIAAYATRSIHMLDGQIVEEIHRK